MRGVSMSVRESNLRSAAPCAFLKDCFDFDSGTELLCFCEIQIIILWRASVGGGSFFFPTLFRASSRASAAKGAEVSAARDCF